MSNYEENDIQGSGHHFLKEPLSIADLIKDGCTFEINSNFDESSSKVDEELNLGSMNLENDDDVDVKKDVQYTDLISPWTKSFEELKLLMEKVNPFIWKRIIKEGQTHVDKVPKNARVCIRYNAFWERESAPFDSSILRGRPFKFETGHGDVLEGLEAAIYTMHPNEQAQFIISYHLLFREMGCPPRIKPKADGLFIIELLSYDLVGNMNAELDIPEEDRHKYAMNKDKIYEIHIRGLDFFKRGRFREAIRAFEKVTQLLKFSIVANEKEAEEQTNFLIRVITNLAVCYNKMNIPNRTCSMCKEIRQLTDKPSCKAIFQEGKACSMLGSYTKARQLLIEAQNMEPNNKAINMELKLLDERSEKYRKNQSELWRKAFGIIKESKIGDKKKFMIENLNFLEQQIQKMILNFISDNKRYKLVLPPGLTKAELDTVKSMAQDMNLIVIADYLDASKYTLIKRECN